jgi:hypothetical protein
MIKTDTTCNCTAGRCCDGYHEIRPEGLIHPDLRALIAERPGIPVRAFRRYLSDGSPIAERVTIANIAMEAGPLP